MNTVSDLHDEFAALAAVAPADDTIRAALADRIEQHARHRRATALVAVVAAVVLVAGGIGLTRSLVGNGPARPAGPVPQPVVTVPDVPLPAGTKLIRHQLRPVTSPVTASPPKGLTGQVWYQTPGRLTVSWFDPDPSAFGWTSYRPLNDSSPAPGTAGYAITDAKDDPITDVGSSNSDPVTPTGNTVSVGGHTALLLTAPAGSVDAMGFPAAQRLTWQLADRRWIHVWATDPSGSAGDSATPSAALAAFAATIAEKPTTLNRTIGIGLTLPGLTHDYSLNSSPLAGYMGASLLLCPSGVDPYGQVMSSVSGSGSAPASASVSVPAETTGPAAGDGPSSVSIAPGAGQSYVTSGDTSPAAPCLTVAVVNGTDVTAQLNSTPVRVDGTIAHVDVQKQAATADLGHGVTAVVGGPTAADVKLSADDLAALVASVRLSPAVTVIPFDAGLGVGGSSASGTASVASTSVVASSGTATPVEGTIAQPFVIPAGTDGANTDDGKRTVSFTFPLQNITDISVTITSLQLGSSGLALTGIKVRLADTAYMDLPLTDMVDMVLPMIVAPRSTIQLQFEFTVGACSEISDSSAPLVIGYSLESSSPDGSSGSGSAGELSLDPPNLGGQRGQGWVSAVTGSLCG